MPSDPQGEPEAIPSVQEFYDALHPTMPSDPQAVLARHVEYGHDHRCHIDGNPMDCDAVLMARALAESEKRAELGDAWAAAEAALPGGWFFTMFISVTGRSYVAHARDTKADEYTQDGDGEDDHVIANRTECNGRGPTPAAALRALAVALLEGEPDAR